MRATQKAVNQVFLNDDGIIHGVYHGPQNAEGLVSMMDRIMKIMKIMIQNDKPVLLMMDIRDLGEYNQAARLVEMHARTILPFWKMAFVTTLKHPEQEQVSRRLTSMSGRRKEIRYFIREDDAAAWLSLMLNN